MKLSLMTWDIAKGLSLEELIQLAKDYGIAGFEFRTQSNHAHGVEVERTKAERAAIRKRLDDAGLVTAGVATGDDFTEPDDAARAKLVEDAKQHIQLAADLGGTHIRVFANKLPEGKSREEIVAYVGAALRQLGEAADGTGVDVGLELHGKFREAELAVGAVKIADHPRVGMIFNSNKQDNVDGSVRGTFDQVKHNLRHVHIHDFEKRSIPYDELFRLLKGIKYDRFVSLELNASDDPKRVLALQAMLYHEMLKSV